MSRIVRAGPRRNEQGQHLPPVGSDDMIRLRQALASLTEEVHCLRQELRASLAPQWKPKPSYTVAEVAQRLGRSAYTIRRWIKEGKLDAIKLNGGGPKDRYLIEHREVQELLLDGGTRLRTLVSTEASGCLRSSSRGRDAGSGVASPPSDGPCSGR